jgi:hypothetical protein
MAVATIGREDVEQKFAIGVSNIEPTHRIPRAIGRMVERPTKARTIAAGKAMHLVERGRVTNHNQVMRHSSAVSNCKVDIFQSTIGSETASTPQAATLESRVSDVGTQRGQGRAGTFRNSPSLMALHAGPFPLLKRAFQIAQDRTVGPVVARASGNKVRQGYVHGLQVGYLGLDLGQMVGRDLADVGTRARRVFP